MLPTFEDAEVAVPGRPHERLLACTHARGRTIAVRNTARGQGPGKEQRVGAIGRGGEGEACSTYGSLGLGRGGST
jgi:butyrate kinase